MQQITRTLRDPDVLCYYGTPGYTRVVPMFCATTELQETQGDDETANATFAGRDVVADAEPMRLQWAISRFGISSRIKTEMCNRPCIDIFMCKRPGAPSAGSSSLFNAKAASSKGESSLIGAPWGIERWFEQPFERSDVTTMERQRDAQGAEQMERKLNTCWP